MYLRGCEDGGRIAAAKARVWHDRAASVGGGGAFERREGLPSPRLLRKVETAAGSTDAPPFLHIIFFYGPPFRFRCDLPSRNVQSPNPKVDGLIQVVSWML
jgi:hypothetical protein